LKHIVSIFLVLLLALFPFLPGKSTQQLAGVTTEIPPLNPKVAKKIEEDKKYTDNFPRDMELLHQALTIIHSRYVDKIKSQKMVYEILKNYCKSLDPYTHFEEPKENKEINIKLRGRYGGLGIVIGMREKQLTIISPIEDTPAEKAGLEPLDKIMEIDGKSTKNMTLDEAVKLMRGKPNTKCVLTIKRPGKKDTFKITITRAIIKLKSVKVWVLKDRPVGYLKITNFNANTKVEVLNALLGLKKRKIKALILDLRRNPGGLLDAAVDVASHFLPMGSLVVYTKGRARSSNATYISFRQPIFPKIPLIILVDKGSASASEIVSGAIKDWERGILIGEKTFGKGSVQRIFFLNNKSAIYLTIAKYFTPKGICIDHKGIEPDISIPFKLLKKSENKKNSTKKSQEKKQKKKKSKSRLEEQEQEDLKAIAEAKKQREKYQYLEAIEIDKEGKPVKHVGKKEDLIWKNRIMLDTQLKAAFDIIKSIKIFRKMGGD